MSKFEKLFKQRKNETRKDTSSGIVTIPILMSITILFLKHRSRIGWGLVVVGVILLLVQIVLSLKITFNTTSLLDYFLMFGGTFGGLGLLARAFLG